MLNTAMNAMSAIRSKAFVSLLVFLCVDLLVRVAMTNGSFDKFDAFNHRKPWWQVKAYKELASAPDVVLIGSSLLEHVVNEGEATYLNTEINSVKHNKSKHFEDAVFKQTGTPINTFAFGLSGLHASDAAVMVNGLLKEKAPATLIYTIAPRDFCDNMLGTIGSTEPFELMRRISVLGELELHSLLNSDERFEHRCSSVFDTLSAQSKYRHELNTVAQRTYRTNAIPLLSRYVEKPKTPMPQLPPDIRQEEFDFADYVAVFPDNEHNVRVTNNLACYQFCYQPFKPNAYYAQFYYLDYMLRFAKQQNMNVILVNMPLRKDNLNAMIPNFYTMYKNDVKKIAAKYDTQFVDMFDTDTFTDADFLDTVHLSGKGSVKFVDKLANAIAPDVAASVVKHGRDGKVAVAAEEE
ncbi:MAG TPA: hypothetical protein V6C76_13965 [Drouetiella sp.]